MGPLNYFPLISRASGHRFRVNDINCHPVLPLLLTTSHHNVVHKTSDVAATDVSLILYTYEFTKTEKRILFDQSFWIKTNQNWSNRLFMSKNFKDLIIVKKVSHEQLINH